MNWMDKPLEIPYLSTLVEKQTSAHNGESNKILILLEFQINWVGM